MKVQLYINTCHCSIYSFPQPPPASDQFLLCWAGDKRTKQEAAGTLAEVPLGSRSWGMTHNWNSQ